MDLIKNMANVVWAYLKSIGYGLIILAFVLTSIFLIPIVVLDTLSLILDYSHKQGSGFGQFTYVTLLIDALKLALFLVAGYLFTRRNQSQKLTTFVLFSFLFPVLVKLQYWVQQKVFIYLVSKPNVINKLSATPKNQADLHAYFNLNNTDWISISGIYWGIFDFNQHLALSGPIELDGVVFA